jgi:hypothetical protein
MTARPLGGFMVKCRDFPSPFLILTQTTGPAADKVPKNLKAREASVTRELAMITDPASTSA